MICLGCLKWKIDQCSYAGSNLICFSSFYGRKLYCNNILTNCSSIKYITFPCALVVWEINQIGGQFNSIFFIIFNYKEIMNAETYINHQLNLSKSKETHKFSKANRFPKSLKLSTEAIYALPPTVTKRTTTFGYGSKVDLAIQTSAPPPGSYKAISDFERKDFGNTSSIYQGRDKVTFGSFILEALKRSKNLPSPDRYNIKDVHNTIGGRIGERIKVEPEMKQKKDIPGPGTYQMNATELGNRGHYVLSTIKNSTSPRYFSTERKSAARSKTLGNETITPPLAYEIQEREVGKYKTSKFRNIMTCSFSKAERPSLEDQSKLKFPGFKYRRFSQFGS